jgi:citrate lyase subunit gamma (acyl carrier protein)
MENIKKAASAGTMESSDAYVEVEPGNGGLDIHVESVVAQQFGQAIEEAVRDVLQEQQVENAVVRVVDRGALECVLRARVEVALLRAKEAK